MLNLTEAQYQKLLGIIIKECERRDKKERYNPYRFGIMLEALDHANNNPKGAAYGINNAFTGSLRNRLLRAIGIDPKNAGLPDRSGAWAREDY